MNMNDVAFFCVCIFSFDWLNTSFTIKSMIDFPRKLLVNHALA